MKDREELKKEFHKWYFDSEGEPDKKLLDAHIKWLDEVLGFFYSEIEAREKRIENLTGLFEQGSANIQTLLTRMSQLEAIIQAADEVIKTVYMTPVRIEVYREKFERALEKYNSLKENSNLKE